MQRHKKVRLSESQHVKADWRKEVYLSNIYSEYWLKLIQMFESLSSMRDGHLERISAENIASSLPLKQPLYIWHHTELEHKYVNFIALKSQRCLNRKSSNQPQLSGQHQLSCLRKRTTPYASMFITDDKTQNFIEICIPFREGVNA